MAHIVYLKRVRKGAFWKNPQGAPRGPPRGPPRGAQSTPEALRVSLIWESDQYHAFFLCILVYMKRIKRGAHQTNPLWAVRPQNANPKWMRMMGSDCEQSLEIWLQILFDMSKTAKMHTWKKPLVVACCSIFVALLHCLSSLHFLIEMSWTGSKVKNKCHLMCWRLLFGKFMEQMFNRLRLGGPRLWWK